MIREEQSQNGKQEMEGGEVPTEPVTQEALQQSRERIESAFREAERVLLGAHESYVEAKYANPLDETLDAKRQIRQAALEESNNLKGKLAKIDEDLEALLPTKGE